MTNANHTRDVAVHGDVEDGYGPSPTSSSGTSASGRTWGPAVRPTSVDGRSWTCGPGMADRRTGKPFEHDTATVIFSCTKGIMAICAYLLVQEGRLDLDVPMATLLAGVRAGRQGGDHPAAGPGAPGRAGIPRPRSHHRRCPRLGSGHPSHRATGPHITPRPMGTRITPSRSGGWSERSSAASPASRPVRTSGRRSAIPLELDTWIGLPAVGSGSGRLHGSLPFQTMTRSSRRGSRGCASDPSRHRAREPSAAPSPSRPRTAT